MSKQGCFFFRSTVLYKKYHNCAEVSNQRTNTVQTCLLVLFGARYQTCADFFNDLFLVAKKNNIKTAFALALCV